MQSTDAGKIRSLEYMVSQAGNEAGVAARLWKTLVSPQLQHLSSSSIQICIHPKYGCSKARTGLKRLCMHACKEDSFSLHDQVTSISLPITELFVEGFLHSGWTVFCGSQEEENASRSFWIIQICWVFSDHSSNMLGCLAALPASQLE